MTTRLLPAAEWGRVADATGDPRWTALDPARTDVLVVEHEGAIVGVLALLTALHAECLWIAPAHRGKARVFGHLKTGLWQEAAVRGAPTVLAAALGEPMTGILTKLGAPLPGTHFVLPMQES